MTIAITSAAPEDGSIDATVHWGDRSNWKHFQPCGRLHPLIADLPRPILLYARQVIDKDDLETFLGCDFPGTKVVVGEGTDSENLRRPYPAAHFLGRLAREDLACAFRAADCLVFPSGTDPHCAILIEAMACGAPVASSPVAGMLNLFGRDGRGASGTFPATIAALDDDLSIAITKALCLDRDACAVFGARLLREREIQRLVVHLGEAAVRQALRLEEQLLETA